MSTPYTLGDVEFHPASFDGWDQRQTAQRVAVLSDGTSTVNEVLQQGSEPPFEATAKGKLKALDDVEILRGYYRTKEEVVFVDPYLGETRTVVVFEFSAKRSSRWVWDYDLTLIEYTPAGS